MPVFRCPVPVATKRRRRVIARTREDILEAASRAFGRTGYHSTTMRDIAREAGYTAGALYTYFKSKKEILGELLARVTEELLEIFDEPVPAGLDFPRRVELLLRSHLRQAERRRDLFVVLTSGPPGSDCVPHTRGRRHPVWVAEVLVERLVRWLSINGTAEDLHLPPEDLARFFFGVTHSFFHQWVMRGAPDGELLRRADTILELFFHGASGKRAPSSGGDHAVP